MVLIAGLCCLACISLWGQDNRATLGGRVTDQQDAVVPGAQVVVTAQATQTQQKTTTNNVGEWKILFLNPGRYTISVKAEGFKVAERSNIDLQTGDIKQIDIPLALGATAETITVSTEVPLIDTTSATSGTVISTQEILEMPSFSRIPTLLATLSPGVIAQDQNQNVARMWSYNAASQFTVDGGRNNVWSNNFVLDGMPNTQKDGKISFIPSTDSVAEFRILTNAYDASIGRQAGGTVSISTKAGTSQYHGNLFEFNQNNILNANQFQTNLAGGAKPPIHFNQYGGTFGGPVWIPKVYNGKQKTFFFVSFDGTRNQDPRFSIRSVPTELERKGDFSQSFTTNQGTRFPIQVYDPLTIDSLGFRTPFPGNVIPASRLSPITQNILKYVPLPNTAGEATSNATNNFVPSSTRQNKMAIISVRGDHQWNNYHKSFATVRWAHEDEYLDDYFNSVATGSTGTRIPKGLGLDHVWTMSASRVLDLRWNVSRYEEPGHHHGAGFDPTQLGFPKSFVSQLKYPSFPRIVGIAGDFGTDQAGGNTFNSYWTWAAGFTHVKSKHTMRYGVEYSAIQQANQSIGNQGQFNFDNSNWTRQQATVGGGTGVGSNVAAFLLGLPNGGNVPNNADAFYSQRFAAIYFQDDWRVTPKLTVNVGLRYDIERPVIERYNRMTSYYDLTALNPINPQAQANYASMAASNATNPLVQQLLQLVPVSAFTARGVQRFAGVEGQSRQVYNTDYSMVQPRVGFAYQIRPTTVIRGGFGRFAQASWENSNQIGFSTSTPFITTNDNYFTPYDTLANPFHSGILPASGSSLGALTQLANSQKLINPNASRPYSWEYSLHLQQQVKSWLFEIGYSHNKTYRIWQDRNMNYPTLQQWQTLRAARFDANGRPMDKLLWDELVPNPFNRIPGIVGGIGSASTVSISQLIRPITYLGDFNMNDNPLGENQYDAMLMKVQRRFSKGFSMLTSFTWSKLFEDTSFLGNQVLNHVEHKLGGEDRPFHLSIAPIWEIPIGRGRKLGRSMNRALDAVVGGWELTGQFNIQSGVPVVFSTDSFFDGQNFALSRDQQNLNKWFDTSHFFRFPNANADITTYPAWTGVMSLPGASYKPASNDSIKNGVYQDFGNYVRNYPTRWGSVRASRTNELNLGIYKNWKPLERMRLQYRFEVFNAFNHPRFSAPNSDPTSSSFGIVSKAQQNSARVVQMALKLYF
jgi:hypothetical protein